MSVLGKREKTALIALGLIFLITQIYLVNSILYWMKLSIFVRSFQVNLNSMSVKRTEQNYEANLTLRLFNPMNFRAEIKYLRVRIHLRYDSRDNYIWILEKTFLHPLPLEPRKEVLLRLNTDLPVQKSKIIDVAINSESKFWILITDLSIITEHIEFNMNKQFLVPVNFTLSYQPFFYLLSDSTASPFLHVCHLF